MKNTGKHLHIIFTREFKAERGITVQESYRTIWQDWNGEWFIKLFGEVFPYDYICVLCPESRIG